MRKLLAVLFCAASLYGQILQTVAATSLPVRYISQSAGSDSNDGLSEKTAWQTLAKVNAATLLAGNTVAQKTGDTWRETLTPGQSGSAGTWYNLQNNGINANYGTSVVIDSNLVYNGGLSVDDTAGIHTGFCTNCTISNNVVHDWHAPVTNINGSGILVDIGSSGNVVKYNYSYNNQTAGITITDAPNTSIYNNTLYNNGRDAANTNGAGIWVGGPSKTSTGIIADNLVQASAVDANSRVIYFATPTEFSGFTFATNLWYLPGGTNWGYNGASNFSSIATWNAQTEVLSPDLNANPTLTNPPTDVTLQSGSPAIGAGVFIPGVSTANPPNIGAK